MRNPLIVAARELHVTLRRKSYLFATFGTPVLFVGVIGAMGLLTARTVGKIQPKTVAVVDSSGVLDSGALRAMQSDTSRGMDEEVRSELDRMMEGLPSSVRSITSESFPGVYGALNLTLVSDADSARSAVRRGELDALLTVAPDYLASGRVTLYGKAASVFEEGEEGGGAAGRMLRRALVLSMTKREGVGPEVGERLLNPMRLERYELKRTGEDAGTFSRSDMGSRLRSFFLPYGFALLMLMSIMMTGNFLLQGVAEEKENRVIEILLSTCTTDEIMLGKVLGQGAAGLLQMAIWLSIGAGILLYTAGMSGGFSLPWGLFVLALGYFVFGYLLVASIMGGVGSLMSSYREAQQFSSWLAFPVVIPLFFLPVILSEPNGVLARVLSYIPITAPVAMMMRLPTEEVPWLEVPLTLLVLLGGAWVAIKLGGRLFRLGSLMYGKRPTLPEIWKWLWQKA
ncbi:MAG: ABC transporter permease [bacterium]